MPTKTATKATIPDASPNDQLGYLHMVALDALRPAAENPASRLDADDPETVALAESIKVVGILEPILIRWVSPGDGEDGWHEIIAGHRRWVAAQLAGLSEVPCIEREVDDVGRLSAMAIENIHRKDLSAIEKARALHHIVEGTSLSQRDIAGQVGMSQGNVSKLLALLKLPMHAQRWVDNGSLTQAAAATIATLPKAVVEDLCSGSSAPPEWRVANARQDLENQRKKDAVIKVAETMGWRVLERRNVNEWASELADYNYVDPKDDDPPPPDEGMSLQAGALRHVNAKAHETEPCHAICFSWRFEMVPCCTDPARHPAPADEVVIDANGDPTGPVKGSGTYTPPANVTAGKETVTFIQPLVDQALARVRSSKSSANSAAAWGLRRLLLDDDPSWHMVAELLEVTPDESEGYWKRFEVGVAKWINAERLSELLAAFAITNGLSALENLISDVYDNDPLPIFADLLMSDADDVPYYAREAAELLDHLDALTGGGAPTLDELVPKFIVRPETGGEVAETPAPAKRAVKRRAPARRAAAKTPAVDDGGGEDAPTDTGSGSSISDEAAAPVIVNEGETTEYAVMITPKGRKFLVSCTEHGLLSKGGSTTMAFAEELRAEHIANEHAGTVDEDLDEEEETDPDAPPPTVRFEQKSGKFLVKCSACGVIGQQSKIEMATEHGKVHLRDAHGVTA